MSIAGAIGGGSKRTRVAHDFNATPPDTTKALLDNYPFTTSGTVWESACGQGHIAEVLLQRGFHVIASDLIDRGYGKAGVDFLLTEPLGSVDLVLTNPPFKLAEKFVRRGLVVSNRWVAMLLRLQFLEGQSRKKFFNETPLHQVLVFSARQACWAGGSPVDENGNPWASMMAFAWFIWDKQHIGPPILRWI